MYHPLRAKVLPSRSNGTQDVVDCLEDVGAAATLDFKMNAPALGSCTALSACLRSSSRIGRSYTTVVDNVHDGATSILIHGTPLIFRISHR
jgi:hypothetical protein